MQKTPIFVLLCMFLCNLAQAIAPVKVGYVEFPPLFSTSNDGSAQGELVDLLDKVLNRAGYQYVVSPYPPKRLFRYLNRGKIDLWLGLDNKEIIRERVLVGQSTVSELHLFAYSLPSAPQVIDFSSLNNKSVIVIRGYGYGGRMEYIKDPSNNITYIETPNHDSGLNLLKIGRADYFLDYQAPINVALRCIFFEQLNSTKLASFPIRFIVSNRSEAHTKLLKALETSFRALSQNATTLK